MENMEKRMEKAGMEEAEEGDWAENVKGVDDYLHGLDQKKQGQTS